MNVSVTGTLPAGNLDTVVVAIAEGAPVAEPFSAAIEGATGRGEVKTKAGHVAHLHVGDTRVIVIGLGAAADVTAESLRVAAAHAAARSGAIGTKTLTWLLPEGLEVDPAVTTGAVVEGTLLRSWSYAAKRKKTPEPDNSPDTLTVIGGDEAAASAAAIVGTAVNWARTQQHDPPNGLTPTELGLRAKALADVSPHLEVEVEGEAAMAGKGQGMGAFLAVSQGSAEEAQLITARYRHPEAKGPKIALVGKAVTFDSGGISIKPAARMHEMKFDMTGGAVVLGAIKAIAELELPVDVIAVVGATENLPSSTAYKPGDIITAADGTTIEITNTDAEGRMVLADCLWYAREQGAEVMVDVATLTGAVVIALGSTHAGLISTDDALADELSGAGNRTGELVWRLPLHPEYAKLMNGTDSDLINGSLERKAGSITAASFLARFTGDTPWAHLDIAGTGWSLGRAYTPRGGAAYGLRLLVDWVRERAA